MIKRIKLNFCNIIIYFILIILSIIWLLPIIWIILQAFGKGGIELRARLIPETFSIDNFLYLFNIKKYHLAQISMYDGLFLKWFKNTLIISTFSCIISSIFMLETAYAFSRFNFKNKTKLMKFNLILGLFPNFLGMIILYWIIKEVFHLEGNYISLIFIYSGAAGGSYYVCKGYFDTISKDIDEAAMIDGASKMDIFLKIILPLSKPIMIYTILISFIAPWGEYIISSYIIGFQNVNDWTVAIGLYKFILGDQDVVMSYYNQFACGAIIVALPITMLFLGLSKYYVEGITGGAIKG